MSKPKRIPAPGTPLAEAPTLKNAIFSGNGLEWYHTSVPFSGPEEYIQHLSITLQRHNVYAPRLAKWFDAKDDTYHYRLAVSVLHKSATYDQRHVSKMGVHLSLSIELVRQLLLHHQFDVVERSILQGLVWHIEDTGTQYPEGSTYQEVKLSTFDRHNPNVQHFFPNGSKP